MFETRKVSQGGVSPPRRGGVAVRSRKRCDSYLSPHRRGGAHHPVCSL